MSEGLGGAFGRGHERAALPEKSLSPASAWGDAWAMKKPVILATLLAFSVLTALAVWHHGYVGIFEVQLQTWAGAQVLVDLAIALTIFLVWVWRDARVAGRNPWPWIVLTLVAGSFGPLLYLLTSRPRAD